MKSIFKSFKRYFYFTFAGYIIINLLIRFDWFFRSNQASSIGIIGGADGPTAIFITGHILKTPSFMLFILFVIALLLYKPLKNIFNK